MSTTITAFDRPTPVTTRALFARYPSGVTTLAAVVDGAPQALVVSSFTVGVSLEPPLVMFAVQNTSSTWPVLRRASRMGVSFMAHDQGLLCRQLASKDSPARFADVGHRRIGSEIYIDGAAGAMSCSIHDEHPAGDHTIIVLRVEGIEASDPIDPLVFHSSRFTRAS